MNYYIAYDEENKRFYVIGHMPEKVVKFEGTLMSFPTEPEALDMAESLTQSLDQEDEFGVTIRYCLKKNIYNVARYGVVVSCNCH